MVPIGPGGVPDVKGCLLGGCGAEVFGGGAPKGWNFGGRKGSGGFGGFGDC